MKYAAERSLFPGEDFDALLSKSLPLCLGIDLSFEQQYTLTQKLRTECELYFWQTDTEFPTHLFKKTLPTLMWVSSAGLQAIKQLPRPEKRQLDLLPKALLLAPSYTLQDFEAAVDHGISEILRPPLSQSRLQEVLAKATEVNAVHHDIMCMTREIILERELLQRKNDLLSFLVNFLTHISDSFEIKAILQSAFEALGSLFTAKSLHAAIWLPDHDSPGVNLHINAPKDSPQYSYWKRLLLEQAKQSLQCTLHVESEEAIHFTGQPREWLQTEAKDGNILYLPIIIGNESFGVLALLTDLAQSLGRDHVRVLDSAMKHLALGIKNANRFKVVQELADYDALTQIHNRRHFEGRLNEELDKFARYGQALSVIMLDIDDFKMINDTYGHQGGDKVLQEIAAIIKATTRITDYCARYGGEEFAILLPHTGQDCALSLAERLRKKIASHPFLINDKCINITVSLGISCLTNKEKNRNALIGEADNALYLAKRSGKNCTRNAYDCKQEES